MKLKRAWWVGAAVLILTCLSLSSVQAKEIVKITISGPGLAAPLEVLDESGLTLFRELDFEGILETLPEDTGDVYYELRYDVGVDVESVAAANIYHYYPAQAGGPGYLYFVDVINGWSSAEGEWFALSAESARELDAFFASHAAPRLHHLGCGGGPPV